MQLSLFIPGLQSRITVFIGFQLGLAGCCAISEVDPEKNYFKGNDSIIPLSGQFFLFEYKYRLRLYQFDSQHVTELDRCPQMSSCFK